MTGNENQEELVEKTTGSLEEVGSVEEVAQRKILRAFKERYSEMVLNDILAATDILKDSVGEDLLDKLQKVHTLEDGTEMSIISEFVNRTTASFDNMIAQWGSCVYPGVGVYSAINQDIPTVFKAVRMDLNDEGLPILDGYYPGSYCVKITYSPDGGVDEEGKPNGKPVSGLRVYIVRSDELLARAVYTSDETIAHISTAISSAGISDTEESYKENNGAYFVLHRTALTHEFMALGNSPEDTFSESAKNFIPMANLINVVESTNRELLAAASNGDIAIITTQEEMDVYTNENPSSSFFTCTIHNGNVVTAQNINGKTDVFLNIPLIANVSETIEGVIRIIDEDRLSVDGNVTLARRFDISSDNSEEHH